MTKEAKRLREDRIRKAILEHTYVKRSLYLNILGLRPSQFTQFMKGAKGLSENRLYALEVLLENILPESFLQKKIK